MGLDLAGSPHRKGGARAAMDALQGGAAAQAERTAVTAA